jgi:glutamyl-tRNA synthetase
VLAERLSALLEWNKGAIQQALKETLLATGLKMPQLAVPVRVVVCGRAQTPSLDAVLEHFDRKKVLERLQSA